MCKVDSIWIDSYKNEKIRNAFYIKRSTSDPFKLSKGIVGIFSKIDTVGNLSQNPDFY